jgi:hypothetical protein
VFELSQNGLAVTNQSATRENQYDTDDQLRGVTGIGVFMHEPDATEKGHQDREHDKYNMERLERHITEFV